MTVNAFDDLAICNAALVLLGEDTINSIENPQTDPEEFCATLWPIVRGALLSYHDWNFANPVRQLARNSMVEPLFGYAYAYKLPSDLLAGPFAVYDSNNTNQAILDYQNANDHIFANNEQIWVKYRANPTVSTMPGYFIDLAVTALAAKLARPVTEKSGLAEEKFVEAYGSDGNGGLFGKAKRIDAQSEPVKSLFKNGDPLTSTRY